MKNLLLGAACSVGLLSAVGCLQQTPYLDPEQNVGNGFNNSSASQMSLKNGRLAGDFGGRRGFNGDASRLEGSNDPAYGMTTVNVVRNQDNVGAAMVILSISGRSLDKYEVGEHTFRYDESSFDQNDQVFVNVCGGPDDSAFDYDAPARSGTITIEDSPEGLRTVDIHTETPVIDTTSGLETGDVELSDSSFAFPVNG